MIMAGQGESINLYVRRKEVAFSAIQHNIALAFHRGGRDDVVEQFNTIEGATKCSWLDKSLNRNVSQLPLYFPFNDRA